MVKSSASFVFMDFGSLLLDFTDRRLVGAAPIGQFEVTEGHWRWQTRHESEEGQGNSLEALRHLIQRYRTEFPNGVALGYVGYEAAREWEPRAFSEINRDPQNQIPDIRLTFFERLETAPQFVVRQRPLELHEVPDFPAARSFYEDGVTKIKDYIAAGDIYQANLTYRFELELPKSRKSGRDYYARLAMLGHPQRGACLSWPDFTVLSNSPETFLTLKDGLLEAKPIKGTIRRGATPAEDERLKTELAASEKNRAENVMIVDLMRNDLGRVCEFGSVHVAALYQIESYPTLHHGVSTVRGRLKPQYDGLDAFKAAFPCGSITGAPKIRAMQILSELENVPRGVAMGAIGYFGFDGSMEWSVAIRTATLFKQRAIFHAGGGIVADSEPENEYDEMRLKARVLWSALSER